MLYSRQRCASYMGTLMRCIVLAGLCLALPAKLLAQSELPELPKTAKWSPGPTVCPLGDIAEIKVPEGYKFTDAAGATLLLRNANNSVPKGLLGLVQNSTEGWWILIEYSPVGYVPEKGAADLDADKIMAAIQERVAVQNTERERAQVPLVEKIDWAMKPTFDSTQKSIEWALKAHSGGVTVLNYTVRLLGRHGIMDATAVRPNDQIPNLTEIRNLVSGIKLKKEQQYASYVPGDKVSNKTMAELVISEDDDSKETKVASTNRFQSIWVAVGSVLLIVCFVAAGATVAVKKLKSRIPEAAVADTQSEAVSTPAPVATPAAAHNGANGRPALLRTTPRANDFARTRLPLNGHARNGEAKRRGFDYNRYFTDLMSHVYSGSYGADNAPVNGNGQEVNGHSYGVGLPVTNGKPLNGYAVADSEVLSAQKSLIEEQRRLIQEQSKLIEEKSRLIEEKNKVLRLQQELMDRKLA